MSRLTRIILGVLGLVIIIVIISILLSFHLVRKSLPRTKGTITVTGINNSIKIYRDELGVPHIFADNEDDLFFAQGYVHAQERLWHMEFNRRAATGTLSEIFGKKTMAIDKFIRTIGIPKIAQQLTESLSPTSKRILSGYTAGINAYLEENSHKLPVEFILLRYKPQPWKIEHTLAYLRLLGFSLDLGWQVDPVIGQLRNIVPPEKLKDIVVALNEDTPELHGGNYTKFSLLQGAINRVQSALNIFGTGLGSNSWVVSGKRTHTGKPLLANDPHLLHQNPSIWYEIHLQTPGLNCQGVSMPGLPGIVIGQNQAIAWGLTNVMADGCDLFIEKINPVDSTQYRYENKWEKITSQPDTIFIKNEPPHYFEIRHTHHGPILSDIHPTLRRSNEVVSIQWNGQMSSDEMFAFYKILKAANWEQFTSALQYFFVPAQNYVYADTSGNIGWHSAGMLPVRRKGNGLLPQPGWTKTYEWIDWIPFDKLPHVFNPPENLIVTANNKKVDRSYPYFITTYWEPRYRASRIEKLLRQKEKLSAEDFRNIQMDQFSAHARFVMPHINVIIPQFKQDTQLHTFFIEKFKNWDLNLDTQSTGGTIFEVFLIKLYENIFKDELGDSLFVDFVKVPNIPIRITDYLLNKEKSSWFDNITTPEVKETKNDILLKTLDDTFEFIKSNFGEITYNWRWGNCHTITFEHILGKMKPLNYLFNIGPFPLGGSATTVNMASYVLNQVPFKTIVGPSMRQIVDLSDMNNSLRVIPTGQSGHPLSKHYKDQTPLWLHGEYHGTISDSINIFNADFDLLILKPTVK